MIINYLTQSDMANTREPTGQEVAMALLIMLVGLIILGDASNIYRSIIGLIIMIVDVAFLYKAQKGG